MKKKLAALRRARGNQVELMAANVACSTETETSAYNAAKAEAAKLAAQIETVEGLLAEEEAPGNETVELAAQVKERGRVLEIQKIAKTGGLEAAFADTHVASGTSIEDFRSAAFNEMARISGKNPTREHSQIVRDATDTRRALMSDAVLHMWDRKNVVDGQNPFRGMGILRMAEELLVLSGISVRGMGKAGIAELSMHKTADFPYVLENSARKRLMNAYQLTAPTYRLWANASTSPDFKTISRPRLSEAPSMLTVSEGAQITLGTMSESRETYALATFGRGVSFTRQMLINDDAGAFDNMMTALGWQVGRMENKTVYAILNANAAMADSVALFHATHANLGTGVIGNTGLDAAVSGMAVQKGLDGVTVLNLEPKFLIVPKAKDQTARFAMTATGPSVKMSDQNNFAGRFTVVSDAELDGTSTIVWYLACDPGMAPLVEYCHLEGADGPQVVREDNQDGILGVQMYVYEDFAAKAVDFRSGWKSSGA